MRLTVHAIQQKVDHLKKYYNVEPSTLKEKIIDAYYKKTLDKLSKICQDSKNFLNKLEKFLAKNWMLVKSTALCYTAIPNNDITKLLCNLAKLVVEGKNKNISEIKIPCGIITILMPGVNTVSIDHLYPDLGPNDNKYSSYKTEPDIVKVLKTHILGRESKYLIPIHLLTQLKKDDSGKKIAHPYYDYHQYNTLCYLSDKEYERLVRHSKLTLNIYYAKIRYQTYVNDKSNLLGHLKQLSLHLYFNSVARVGHETNAGGGAYSAIINFMEYYNTLGVDEKAKIPKNVSTEIEKLLNLSSDSKTNFDATENFDTCISTRVRLETIIHKDSPGK